MQAEKQFINDGPETLCETCEFKHGELCMNYSYWGISADGNCNEKRDYKKKRMNQEDGKHDGLRRR